MDILYVRDMPESAWKNGGGLTRVLAAHPCALKQHWRISLATITRDGPYSSFVGLMRHQTIVSGAGLALCGDADQIDLSKRQGRAFSGDLALMARLKAGPVTALNVIWDEDQFSADVQLIHSDPVLPATKEGGQSVCFGMTGPFKADGTMIAEGDAITWSGECPRITVPQGGDILVVTLAPRA